MTRVTCAVASRRRRKRLLKLAKGFVGDRKNHLRMTKDAVMTAMSNNYKHRKLKKREFRCLWIARVSVGAKINGMSYSKMMNGLKRAGCALNRKVLSEMAIHDPSAFEEVAKKAKAALAS